uniref:Uncharacterized protein n=1 Tax=Solanum tuberosum TaxID=4113 RepID=M1DAL1_SOLTU
MQHKVEPFLSSELGHSPKKSVKLLGREQMSDFHHNQTTPLSKSLWVLLRLISPSFASGKFWVHQKQFSNLSDNAPRALGIMSVRKTRKNSLLLNFRKALGLGFVWRAQIGTRVEKVAASSARAVLVQLPGRRSKWPTDSFPSQSSQKGKAAMGDNNEEIDLIDVVVAQPVLADQNELILQLMQQIAEMRVEM